MKLALRPLQVDAIASIGEAFRLGYKRVMVCAPCGFGKTELATGVLQATYDNDRRGIFLADRISLVTQTGERFDKYDLPHGVMQGDHWRWKPSEPIQICSVQTLAKRGWPNANLMVVDEAHVLSTAVRKKLDSKDCYAIGLTATPITEGLGKYFDYVVNAATTNQLIELGLLVPLRIFSCVEPDMEGVKVVAGEWEPVETQKRALQVVGDVVQEYMRHGGGKKFIGFAASIAHAEELQRQFIALGVNVATYTADDKPEDRSEVVQEFRKPDSTIRGLLSVEALTRGFDVTDVEVLILARPLRKSVALHVQMLGRVMRAHAGKTSALVLDHAGNCGRFWAEWNELFQNGVSELDDGKKKPKEKPKEKPEAKPVKCSQCGHLHKPAPSCPACGFEYPKKSLVEHVPGTLKEILATGDADLQRKLLWPMVAYHAVRQSSGDMVRAQRIAQAIYKDITGDFARARVETTKLIPASLELEQKIKGNRIKWSYAQKAKENAAKWAAPAPIAVPEPSQPMPPPGVAPGTRPPWEGASAF